MSDRYRSRISRQFTDAETALDDRITSHLTAPPLELRTGDTVGQSYKWLSEDLALRSTLSKQLAGEQAMAYAQSERRALADQAQLQQEQDEEALAGLTEARSLLESGKSTSAKDAIYQTVGKNPRLGINPMAGKLFSDLEATFESPEQQELRQRKIDLDLSRAEHDKFITDTQNMTDAAIGGVAAVRRNIERFQQEGITAANDAIYQEQRGIMVRESLRQAKEAQQLFTAIGDPANRPARIRAQGVLRKIGLDGVEDLETLASIASRDELTMAALMDDTGRKEILDTPEKQQLYVDQWNTLASSQPGSLEYKRALSAIDAVTAEWDERNGDRLRAAKANADMVEISKDFSDSWETVSKEIDSIVQAPTNKLPKDEKPTAMLNTYARFFGSAMGQGADDVVKKYAKLTGEQLAAANSKESKLDVKAVNEFISASGLAFSQEFKAAKARAMAGKAAIKEAAKAADDAAPVKVSTPEEAAKLPSGTIFVGPDGVTRTRP